MAVSVTFYNTSSEPGAINKNLSSGTTFSGDIVGAVDVVRPSIKVESNLYGYNYAYIPKFGRYYYITEIEHDRTGLDIVHLKSDPLMSFKADILALPAIAIRCEQYTAQSPYIIDTQQQVQAYKQVETYVLGTFNTGAFKVLVTAG